MTFAATIDENGQLTLPPELREHLDLTPNTIVEFQEQDGVVTLSRQRPQSQITPEERVRRLKAAVAALQPSMRAAFLAEGWTSVEEYMDDMRGR